MGFVLAFLFVAVAAVALVLYGGTPHGGPTATCGPVNFLGNRFTIGADCRYVSVGELAAAGVCFFFAMMSLLAARPHRQ